MYIRIPGALIKVGGTNSYRAIQDKVFRVQKPNPKRKPRGCFARGQK